MLQHRKERGGGRERKRRACAEMMLFDVKKERGERGDVEGRHVLDDKN